AVDIEIVDEAARTQHMRIVEQVFGPIDRREADVERVEFRCELSYVPTLDDLGHARNDSRAREDAVGGRVQALIVQQILHPELPAEALPVALGDDADEDALAVRRIKYVVDRPGVLALRHRARLVAGHL